MPFLWRISNHQSLSGEGGLQFSARWHTAGRRIVYLAESPAGAMIEVLVHLELDETDWPRVYQLIKVEYPAKQRVETLKPGFLRSWRTSWPTTRRLGDEWLRSGRSALARAPSAILPETWNLVLNPNHPDAQKVRIVQTIRAEYDPRLLRVSLQEDAGEVRIVGFERSATGAFSLRKKEK
jgi:RES domain-containing protein